MTDPAAGTEYLSLEDLLDLVNALGAGPVRDLGLLDSAGHRPQASFFGKEAYPTLTGKAAALMHSLAGNDALVDGNKRLALLATAVFLRINGYVLDLTDDDAFDLTMSVAARQLDADGIQKRLRLAQAPRDPPDPCILARLRLHASLPGLSAHPISWSTVTRHPVWPYHPRMWELRHNLAGDMQPWLMLGSRAGANSPNCWRPIPDQWSMADLKSTYVVAITEFSRYGPARSPSITPPRAT